MMMWEIEDIMLYLDSVKDLEGFLRELRWVRMQKLRTSRILKKESAEIGRDIQVVIQRINSQKETQT